MFPDLPQWTSGLGLAEGADLLIHDAQYADNEYNDHVGWCHSSIGHAVAFHDEEVVEQPTLGGEQGAEARLARRHGLDILGDQTLQEVSPVRAAERDQCTAFEGGVGQGVGHDRNLGCAGVERQH